MGNTGDEKQVYSFPNKPDFRILVLTKQCLTPTTYQHLKTHEFLCKFGKITRKKTKSVF